MLPVHPNPGSNTRSHNRACARKRRSCMRAWAKGPPSTSASHHMPGCLPIAPPRPGSQHSVQPSPLIQMVQVHSPSSMHTTLEPSSHARRPACGPARLPHPAARPGTPHPLPAPRATRARAGPKSWHGRAVHPKAAATVCCPSPHLHGRGARRARAAVTAYTPRRSEHGDARALGLVEGLELLAARAQQRARQRELDLGVVELQRVGALAGRRRHGRGLDDLRRFEAGAGGGRAGAKRSGEGREGSVAAGGGRAQGAQKLQLELRPLLAHVTLTTTGCGRQLQGRAPGEHHDTAARVRAVPSLPRLPWSPVS
jgi:hypothetical protein